MSWQPAPAAPQTGSSAARPGRTLIWVGAVLFLVALVAGIVAVVLIVSHVGRPLADAMQNPAYETPADFRMNLDPVRYTVYATSVDGNPSIGPDDVTVTAPDGEKVAIDRAGDLLETVGRGARSFVGAARFLAPAAGSYQIQVAEQPDALVVVAPSIVSSAEDVGYSALGALAAGAVGLVGLVLFIVGMVRRSSANKQAAFAGQGYPGQGYPGSNQPYQPYQPQQNQPQPNQPNQPNQPPAGWYPDPGTPGKSRYWDGGSWTEHQR